MIGKQDKKGKWYDRKNGWRKGKEKEETERKDRKRQRGKSVKDREEGK